MLDLPYYVKWACDILRAIGYGIKWWFNDINAETVMGVNWASGYNSDWCCRLHGPGGLVGLNVAETSQRTKAIILAINKKGGKLLANPPGENVIAAGDQLIVMGSKEQLGTLESICKRC